MTIRVMNLNFFASEIYKAAIMVAFAMGAILLFAGFQAFQKSLELHQLILSSYCNTSGSSTPSFMATHCLPCYQMVIGGLLLTMAFFARRLNNH